MIFLFQKTGRDSGDIPGETIKKIEPREPPIYISEVRKNHAFLCDFKSLNVGREIFKTKWLASYLACGFSRTSEKVI